LKKLEWFLAPIAHCFVDQALPAFSVTSASFIADTLQLLCHGKPNCREITLSAIFFINLPKGGAVINGDIIVDLELEGLNDPSMAIFNNITFSQRMN
jgi:hypothetical protein